MALEVKKEMCKLHPEQELTGKCGYCGKGICRECISAWGYYCSEQCNTVGRESITAAEKAHTAYSRAKYEQGMKVFRYFCLGLGAAAVLAVGFIVYRVFLDPSGKVVWRWTPESAEGGDSISLRILGRDQDKARILIGDTLYTLDLDNGKIVSKFQSDDLAGLRNYVIKDGQIIGSSPVRVFRAGCDGSNPSNLKFTAMAVSTPVLTSDLSTAYFITEEPLEEVGRSGRLRRQSVLHALDLGTGNESWTTELKKGASVSLVGAVDRNPLIFLRYKLVKRRKKKTSGAKTKAEPTKLVRRLELLAHDSGKTRRRASVPEALEWGPKLINGWVLFRLGKSLHTLNFDQKSEYKFPVEVKFREPKYLIRDSQLLILYSSSTVCYDLATGKQQWKLNAGAYSDGVFITKKCIYMLGSRSEKSTLKLDSLPGFGQMPEGLAKDFGLGTGMKMKRSVSFLAAIDRRKGKIIWQKDHARGDLVADGKRVVLIMNTKETSNFSFFIDENDVVVRQYDPGSGSLMYEQVTPKIALGDSILMGDRVLGTMMSKDGKLTLMAVALR